ncbi:MAG: IgGFc-binding protein [Deltaproteobacteria bacterium]|nr:IgGFc-binding protein [Deltaproteobacteria bacterium]MCB9785778.1 IgGFc-binding protein [Deltaproteobacteria bacterium]
MRRGLTLTLCSLALLGSLGSLAGCSASGDGAGSDLGGDGGPGPVSDAASDLGPGAPDGVGSTDVPPGLLCNPGDRVCAGPQELSTCDGAGASWVETVCPAQQGCADGACIARICSPGASSGLCTDGSSYERCNDSGTAKEIVHCGEGAYCLAGTCITQLCTPGAKICKNFTQLKVCTDGGDAWVDGPVCPDGGACFDGACLSPCEVNIKDGSYLGCDYWAMDLDNIEGAEFQTVGIVVSVPAKNAPTNVVITNNATGQPLTVAEMGVDNTFVPAGQVKVFKLPLGFDINGTQLTKRTFRIATTSPVAVHQFNPLNGEGVFTNDASLLLPSKVTGQEYYVMAWPHRKSGGETLRGYATVVATQEGQTVVSVRPTAAVVAGGGIGALQVGSQYLFVLEQGQALNLESDGEEGADLTGTYIKADKRISVIGGHECANVPLGVNACDHLESQLFPVETWSTDYVADAFEPRSAAQVDIWRVMAGGNEVTVETVPPVKGYEKFKLQRGGWLQFASSDSFLVKADGPIMVGHYLTGSSYPGAEIVCVNTGVGSDTAIGDPAFTLAIPTKRYLKEYSVLTPTGYLEDYLNIIAPPATNITIDDQPLTTALVPIAGTSFAVARVTVQPGVHTVKGDQVFGLTAYGYDCDVSYAYPGGLKLQALTGN